jgi:hypothetical protein
MIKSESRSFMNILSVLSEPATVYTLCWAWLSAAFVKVSCCAYLLAIGEKILQIE